MRLTQAQKEYFNTFGFMVFPGLLNDIISSVTQEFESLWSERGGGPDGTGHTGKARSCMVQFIDRRDRLCALLDDPRIHCIACDLMGDDFNYWGSDGNYYVGDTPWHSDSLPGRPETRDLLRIKFALYLDPLTRETGALRVIPGSHKYGDQFADKLEADLGRGALGIHGRDVPSVALASNPGDLVIFDTNTKHAAYGGSERRRMFTMVMTQRIPKHRENELRDSFLDNQKWHLQERMIDYIDRPYGERMTKSASPQRLRHLEQLEQLMEGGQLAKLSKQVKESMLAAAQK